MADNTRIIPMMIYKNGSLQTYQIKIVNPGKDMNSLHNILFSSENIRNHHGNREIFILDNNNRPVSNRTNIIDQLRDNASKVNHISPSIRNRTVTFIKTRDNLRHYYLVEQNRLIYLGFISDDIATTSSVTIDPCAADINIKEIVQRLQGTSVQKQLDIWRIIVETLSPYQAIIKYFIVPSEKSICHQSGIATEINLHESLIRYQGEKLGKFKNWFILASYNKSCDLNIENKSNLEYNVYWLGDIIKSSSNNRTELLIDPGIRYSKQRKFIYNPTEYTPLQDQQCINNKQPVQNHVRTGQWNIIRPEKTEEQDKAFFNWLESLGIIEKHSKGEHYRKQKYYGEPCKIYGITIKNTLDSHKQFIDQMLKHRIISEFNTKRGNWRFVEFRREDHLGENYDSENPDFTIETFVNLLSLQLRKDSEILKNVETATGDSNYLDK